MLSLIGLALTACDFDTAGGERTPASASDHTTNIRDLCALSATEIWAAQAFPAALRKTKDGGKTWVDVFKTNATNGFIHVQCLGPTRRRVVAIGEEGGVWASDDGGGQWRALEVRLGESIKAAAWYDTAGLAVGMDGVIRRTDDSGATWGTASSGVQVTLYGVAFGDSRRAWAVGGNGTVIASDDGGRTWRQQESGATSPLFGVSFGDATHGWCVGRDGTIVHTADAGSTWRTVASGVSSRLTCVHAVGAEIVVVAGDKGTCRSSTDAGRSWRNVEVPASASWTSLEVRENSFFLGGEDLRFVLGEWR